MVAYCGATVPISRAIGLALGEPFTDADADTLETFYRFRGCPAVVLLSPFADESIYIACSASAAFASTSSLDPDSVH